MADVAWGWVLLYIIASPFRLVYSVFSIFGVTVWRILRIVLLPVTIPSRWIYNVLLLLFHIVAELQTILSFIGTAVIVGLVSGVALYYVSNALISVSFSLLQLEDQTSEGALAKPAATYREQRRQKKAKSLKSRIKSESAETGPTNMEALERLAKELLEPYSRGNLQSVS